MPDETPPEPDAPAETPPHTPPTPTVTVPAYGFYAVRTRIGDQSTYSRLSLPAGELEAEITITRCSY